MQKLVVRILRPLGYERVYLLLCEVADTPFHTQKDELSSHQRAILRLLVGLFFYAIQANILSVYKYVISGTTNLSLENIRCYAVLLC